MEARHCALRDGRGVLVDRMLFAATALRRTILPAPVAAVLLGGAVVVVDSLLADLGEAREAATAAESPIATGSADD